MPYSANHGGYKHTELHGLRLESRGGGTLEGAWAGVGLGAIETPQESQKQNQDVRFTPPRRR